MMSRIVKSADFAKLDPENGQRFGGKVRRYGSACGCK